MLPLSVRHGNMEETKAFGKMLVNFEVLGCTSISPIITIDLSISRQVLLDSNSSWHRDISSYVRLKSISDKKKKAQQNASVVGISWLLKFRATYYGTADVIALSIHVCLVPRNGSLPGKVSPVGVQNVDKKSRLILSNRICETPPHSPKLCWYAARESHSFQCLVSTSRPEPICCEGYVNQEKLMGRAFEPSAIFTK